MFKNMFGGKSKKRPVQGPSPSDAIQRIRNVEEVMIKKQDYLQKKIESELEIIRKNGTKNKKTSLEALKRKKRLENQLTQIDGTLTTLESQRISLENAQTNVEVLRSMKVGADALKVAQSRIGDADRVADVMDDIREQQELAKEITDMISNPIGFGHDVGDDDELLQELEELEQQCLDEELLNTDSLPTVPTTHPQHTRNKTKSRADDDDMRALSQWAN